MTTNDTITDAMIRAGCEAYIKQTHRNAIVNYKVAEIYRAMRAAAPEESPMLHDIEPDTRTTARPDAAAIRQLETQLEGHHLRLMGLERAAKNANQRIARLPDQIRADGGTARALNARIDALDQRVKQLETWTREEVFARTADTHDPDEPEPPASVVSDAAVEAAYEAYWSGERDPVTHVAIRRAIEAALAVIREEQGASRGERH